MIRIELDDHAVRQALDRLARRVNNLTPALHNIGQALMGAANCFLRYLARWQKT
jgi:hypothetical protein